MAGASVLLGRRCLNGLLIAADKRNFELVPLAGVAAVRIFNYQRFRHARTTFR